MMHTHSPYSTGRMDGLNNRAHRFGSERLQFHQLFTPQQQRNFAHGLRSVNQIIMTKPLAYPVHNLKPVKGRWPMAKEFRIHILNSDDQMVAESNYVVITDVVNLDQYFHGLRDGLLKAAVDFSSKADNLMASVTR